MTVLSRKFASIPVCSATETWVRMVNLLAPSNSEARAELLAATGIAASLIAREAMTASPAIVAGKGPQVRIYCVHGEDAIEGNHVYEAALPASPAESEGWALSFPCPKADLSWVQGSLKEISNRMTARDEEEHFLSDSEEQDTEGDASINTESFLRP